MPDALPPEGGPSLPAGPVPLVKQWLESHFENFGSIFPRPFETVEVQTVADGQQFTALFLASSASDWLAVPQLTNLVTAASSSGLKVLERAMRGVPWGATLAAGDLFIGTRGFQGSVVTRAGEYTLAQLRQTIWSEHNKAGIPPFFSGFWTFPDGTPLETIVATPEWQRIAEMFAVTPLGAPKDLRIVTLAEARAAGLSVPIPSTYDGSPSMMGHWHGNRNYDLGLMKLFGWGRTVFYAHIGGLSGNSSDVIAFSVPSFGDGQLAFVDISRLAWTPNDHPNNAFQGEYTYGQYFGYVALNVAADTPVVAKESLGLVATVGVMNTARFWLPLLGPPGAYEMAIRSNPALLEASVTDDGLGWTHKVIKVSGDVLTGIPVEWYSTYANENTGAANFDAITKAQADLAEYSGTTLCSISFEQPWKVPPACVTRLKVYSEYKKAKEKACKKNDFMEQKFLPNLTFQAAQDKATRLGVISQAHSYRDPSFSPGALDLASFNIWEGFTLSWDSAAKLVHSVRPDASAGPSFSAAEGEDFIEAYYSGAVLTGATVDVVLLAWGISPTDYVSRSAGMLESKKAITRSTQYQGTELSYTGFDWRSVGFNGYPELHRMNGDEAIRAALVSICAIAPLATKLRRLFLGYGRDAVIRSALVPPVVPTP